jgi:tetratricopeptide (TPR) repeat protein
MHINHLLDHRDVVGLLCALLLRFDLSGLRSYFGNTVCFTNKHLLQATMEALPETISATHANSCAILQLLEGNQEESVALFHRALNDARDIIRYLGGFGGAHLSKFSLGSTYVAVVSSISLEGVIQQRNPSVLSAQGIYVSMYRSIFAIEGNDCEREVMIGEVTVVILYNLAVLHQELGLSMANNNAIDKALRLYELAQSTLGQVKAAKGGRLSLELVEVELAILTNLGHAYSYFFLYEGAMQCREALQERMSHLEEAAGASQLEADVYQFFRQNVLLSYKMDHGVAPAA